MLMTGTVFPEPHRRFRHCAEELLLHTSRYYHYAEAFLADLASDQGFSMDGYHSHGLSKDQRWVLAELLAERPSPEVGRQIIGIVSDVVRGRKGVENGLLKKYPQSSPRIKSSLDFRPRGAVHYRDKGIFPTDPFQNMARRLQIPMDIKGQEVKVPLRLLGKHLDSPNPIIRQNLQESILALHEGGYHLVNTPYPGWKRYRWNTELGFFRGLWIHWRVHCHWLFKAFTTAHHDRARLSRL